MKQRIRLAAVIGTRPEAVKMAPIIRGAAERADVFDMRVVSTSQHREMLEQMFRAFQIRADVDLELMQPNQGLSDFAARALAALGACFDRIEPDTVLVQGDTTTVVAAALAAFHRKVAVGHVEAGLRSFNRFNPFPEEVNRRLAATLATLHFAPTERARQNLLREGVPGEAVFVTGNTVVDALQMIRLDDKFESDAVQALPLEGKRLILVTAHRRENHGEPLREICTALKRLAQHFSDVHIVFPVHLHPAVQSLVRAELDGIPRISLVEPVGYPDMLRLIRLACLVLTDSGGIQEEAPSFRKPVLILRETTERPELVEAGGAVLVGTRTERIVAEAARLLEGPRAYQAMCLAQNPFGDGHAAAAILDILATASPQHNARLHSSSISAAPTLSVPQLRPDGERRNHRRTALHKPPLPTRRPITRNVRDGGPAGILESVRARDREAHVDVVGIRAGGPQRLRNRGVDKGLRGAGGAAAQGRD